MDLTLAVRNLAGDLFTSDEDYVVVRCGHRAQYERDNYVYIGEIPEARGLTGHAPMVVMQKPAPALEVGPSETKRSWFGG